MPPKKKTKSNNMTSEDRPSHGDSESRQHASSREEERTSEGTFTLTDLFAAIHAMGENQREMAETIKELKSSAAKPSEENKRLPQDESDVAGKGSEQKGAILCHPRRRHYNTGKRTKSKPGGLEVSSSAAVSIKLTLIAIS
ncbi:unnamed protein product [Prunus armeniaca]